MSPKPIKLAVALLGAALLPVSLAAACPRSASTPTAAPGRASQTARHLTAEAAATSISTPGRRFKLSIVHTSENHGHWEPVTVGRASQGGIARRAALFEKIRAEGGNVLFLDSGDISQGTLFFPLYEFAEGRELYNLLGYDAICPGNHEFDLGPAVLAKNLVKDAKFAIVLSNVDVSAEPALAGKIPPFVVKTIDGEKIGLFGMITDDLPFSSQPGKNIRMKDAVATAREMVAALTARGVNKIILLSHRGYPEDLALAANVDGIDVVVSGHTETLLGNADALDRALGRPAGPYPTVVRSPDGDPVLIVHAFVWGRTVGRLNATFDDKGVATSWDGGLILIDNSHAKNRTIAARVAELAKPVETLKKEVIGSSVTELQGERRLVRNRETNLGNLITDAMLAATAWDHTQIALTNGGSIRAGINAGRITLGQLLEALPFGNRLVHFDLKGSDIIAALENGLRRISLERPGDSAGGFLQVAGLRFAADLTKPVGKRITKVEVGTTSKGFKALDPAGTYRVVTNDFLFAGGDGFGVFQKGTNVKGGDVPIHEALVAHLQARSPVSPKVEGRITLFTASATPP